MSTRPQPRTQHTLELAAERDVARAEGDYRRLRAACLDLANGDANEVELAMVGADMARAQATLLRLRGLRQLSAAIGPGRVVKRETLRFAEATA